MGTKKLTAIPTVSLCGPDVAYAAVWPIGSDINIFAHFVTQIVGHTSAYATVWPRRRD